jgi:hypothetical protein
MEEGGEIRVPRIYLIPDAGQPAAGEIAADERGLAGPRGSILLN